METVVLVHGAWMNAECWDGWAHRIRSAGHPVLAPSWPGDERPVAALKASPDPGLARLGIAEIVDHYDRIVRALPAPPILIGHSFGGLFVQLLLDRGLGAAGVALDPAPPRGVLPTLDALRSSWPVVSTWAHWRRLVHLPFAAFQRDWVADLPPAEQRTVYDRFVVPTPGRIYLQAALAPFHRLTRIGGIPVRRAPLLMVAGGRDRTVPPAMVRAAFRLQRRTGAPTELLELPEATHWLVGQPGWQDLTDRCLGWAVDRVRNVG